MSIRGYFQRPVVYVTKSVDVEVEVDVAEMIESVRENSPDLAAYGLVKATAVRPLFRTWECVARAVRDGDQRQLVDLLSTLAWDQAGIVIRPVI